VSIDTNRIPKEQAMTDTKTPFTQVGVQLAASVAERGLDDAATADLDFLRATLGEVATHSEALMKVACRVEELGQRVRSYLDERRHVNSLGELQGTALDFDRLCALRESAIESYVRARHYVVRGGRLHEDAIARFESNAGYR
jgi:hypothetical protein